MSTVTKIKTYHPASALRPEWFQRDTQTVAQDLIGCLMFLQYPELPLLAVRIVETEAYLPENDLACHAARSKTKRNAVMFNSGGCLYVYRIYGIHMCANVVTETQDRGCAVLLRAAEMVEGEEFMLLQRGDVDRSQLMRGPGNFCQALAIDLQLNGQSCSSPTLWFQARDSHPRVHCSTRIGITQSADLLLRFYDADSKAVSAHRKGSAVPSQK